MSVWPVRGGPMETQMRKRWIKLKIIQKDTRKSRRNHHKRPLYNMLWKIWFLISPVEIFIGVANLSGQC